MPYSRRWLLASTAALAASMMAADVPRPSPDFSINMLDGTKLPVRQFRGKVVLLMFFNTSCPHCQHATEVLNGVQKEYGPKGVQVLGSAMDVGGKGLLPDFLKRFQPVFPVGYNDHVEALTFMQTPLIAPGFVPKMAFLDREGVIREQHAGEEPYFQTPEASIRNTLDGLLKASAAPRQRALPR